MLNFKIEDLKMLIRRNEGDRLDVYADILGIWTTGNGFNMERPDAARVCASCGIDYNAAMALKGTRKQAITDTQRNSLLDHCISEVLAQVGQIVPGFDHFTGRRQLALLDVAWAGIGTLDGFHRMLAAIDRDDWNTAAIELLDSRLASQWGRRALLDAEALKIG